MPRKNLYNELVNLSACNIQKIIILVSLLFIYCNIADPFPPPNDIQLVQISAEQLEFNWSAPTVDCPGLSYCIESNCGMCSNYTNSTYTTCFINQDATTINMCNFAVGTIICDSIVGNLSNPLNIQFVLRGISE